jgi:hypothetical protein
MNGKVKYAFRRDCLLTSGKFYGFNSWKSIVGHGVAIIGLAWAAKGIYLVALVPAWKGLEPRWNHLVEFTKRDLAGEENNEMLGKK